MSVLSPGTGLLNRVGPLNSADGSFQFARSARNAENVAILSHGKYAEAVFRGNVFGAVVPPGTGVATGTALGVTAMISLFNPSSSGVVGRVLKVSAGYISGTLGAGTLFHCLQGGGNNTAPSAGTGATMWNVLTGVTTGNKLLARFSSTVLTPTLVIPFASLFAELATTANGAQLITEDCDGWIQVAPGNYYHMQFVGTAGTAPLLAPALLWEEYPYP